MCYTHTLYFSTCGCYSKPQIYGEPCIRAIKGPGLATRGCWDTIDYGVDSVDEACPRCQRLAFDSGSGSSSDRRLSEATTLADSRRPSGASGASSASIHGQAQDEVRGPTADCLSTALLTAPGATIKRVSSASSLISTSSTLSRASRSHQARALLNALPANIPTVRRCPSGVSLSDNSQELWTSAKPKEGAENLHWRAYDDGIFKSDLGVEAALVL